MKLNKTYTKIEFTKKEMQGILRNLKAIHKLLKKPGVWIQGSYYNEPSDIEEPATMCLMGANDQVDGPAESNTNVFMCFNLPEPWLSKYLWEVKRAVDYAYDEKEPPNMLIADIYAASDGDEGGYGFVEEFNDAKKTTLSIVLAWLRKLIEKAVRLS